MKLLSIILTFCFCFPICVNAVDLSNEMYTYELEENFINITGINDNNLHGKIYVPANIDNIAVKKINAHTFFNANTEEIEFSEGINTISSHAISDCANLKKVIIPATCKMIGGISLMPAIEYCENLETIEIYGEYESLPLFVADCPNLKNITFYGDVININNEFKYNFYKCEPRVKRVNPRVFTNASNITIQGQCGSNIEKFAKENGFNFTTIKSTNNAIAHVSEWAKEEITKAEKLELIPEILDGKDLTDEITRAEFAAVAIRVYENLSGSVATPAVINPFTDTKDIDVLKAYNIEAVVGTSATTYSPDDLLNREQLATMLTRVFKKKYIPNWTLSTDSRFALNYEKPTLFTDDESISDWAKENVYFMVANKIIYGVGNNKFAPKNTTAEEQSQGYANATREQALLIAVRMVENLK